MCPSFQARNEVLCSSVLLD